MAKKLNVFPFVAVFVVACMVSAPLAEDSSDSEGEFNISYVYLKIREGDDYVGEGDHPTLAAAVMAPCANDCTLYEDDEAAEEACNECDCNCNGFVSRDGLGSGAWKIVQLPKDADGNIDTGDYDENIKEIKEGNAPGFGPIDG